MTRRLAVAALLVVVAGCGDGTISDEEERRLPINVTLALLCPGDPPTPPAEERKLRARAEQLVEDTRNRPDAKVHEAELTPDDDKGDYDVVTIREVAEQQLEELESGDCEPALRRELREALKR
ncbi:MAG TPA: hypothetical protein VF587_18325 [Solirubrobacteraceae bacterium]